MSRDPERWDQSSGTAQLYGIPISAGHRSTWQSTAARWSDSSLVTTSPDHQAVSPKCLLNKTCYPCKKEGNIFLLSFCLRWLRGSVPPIPSQDYLIPQQPKCAVHVRTFKDCNTSNILDSQVTTNNSICFRVPTSKSQHIQCESKKIPPKGSWYSHFSHKRLGIFNRFFTHLLYVPIYARLQIFIQLSPTLTKLCHIKLDYPVHIICAKCPKRAKMRAFRRLRKSLIDLLIVVCGK